MIIYALIPFFAFAITFIVIARILGGGGAQRVLDHPNARSLHTSPVPRSGGLAILLPVLIVDTLVAPHRGLLLICTAAVASVSFLDDWRGVSVVWRLLAHFATAVVFALFAIPGLSLHLIVLCVIALVWTSNLYNFMDGSNGLAGGMTAIGFAVYAFAAWHSGDTFLSIFCVSIASSALAFLHFNFPSAKIFLGDAGSIPLGFLASAIGVIGWNGGTWPAWFPILVFSPFVVDASVTLVKRFARGERVWQAHRSHYYQRLILMGWSHRRTALVEYVLMLAAGITALWGARQSGVEQAICVSVWTGIYFIFAVAVDRKWRLRARPT